MFSWFSSGSHGASANDTIFLENPLPKANFPKAHVFVTDSLHIHLGSSFLKFVQETIQKQAFTISLVNFEDEDSGNLLITVKSVIEIAKLFTNIHAHNTIEAPKDMVPLMVSYEIGKLESLLNENDNVILFTLNPHLVALFNDKDVGRYHVPVHVVSVISKPSEQR
jgi:hypothetical protein